jgi:hypothetical protein
MGTLIILAVVGLGVVLGIVIFSLLSMAQRTDQIYDCMLGGEEIAPSLHPLYRPASEALLPTSSGEARPQRDLSASVAAQKPEFVFRGPSGPNNSVLFVSQPD